MIAGSNNVLHYSAAKLTKRKSVSIICVYNDLLVRQRCLDRSIEAHREEASDVEYLPINNVDGAFQTAAAALNYGASLASHDYLVFVHQDVYLHSLRALEEAAGILAGDYGFGLLGAIGIGSDGRLLGRIRDRVVLMGAPVRCATVVDSIDEVLFIAPRHLILCNPLMDTPAFAWHAYAVEYGIRIQSLGLKVGVIDMPLTHNSLTVNLERLDVSHAAIAVSYPSALPIHTTCGTISKPSRQGFGSLIFPSQRWRYRWLRESIVAYEVQRAAGGGLFVLSDIRQDIDEVLEVDLDLLLLVINHDNYHGFWSENSSPLELMRFGKRIAFKSMTMTSLIDVVTGQQPGISLLITNLTSSDLKILAPWLNLGQCLIGFDEAIGCWILLGSIARIIPEKWRSPKARPLGMPKLQR